MAITPKQLSRLNEFVLRAVEINQIVLKGIIPNLQKNMALVMGVKTVGKDRFYRQYDFKNSNYKSLIDFARSTIIARAVIFIVVLYLTNRERGEILILFFETVFDYVRAESSQIAKGKDFWLLVEEILQLLANLQRLFANGKKQEAQEVNTKLAYKTGKQLPVFLRKTKTRQRKRPKMTASK